MDPFYAGDGWRGSICVKTRRCLLKSALMFNQGVKRIPLQEFLD